MATMETDFLTIPDALTAYTRDRVFYLWQSLERQLSQVDPAAEPEVYQALDERTAVLFNVWLGFRYYGQGA